MERQLKLLQELSPRERASEDNEINIKKDTEIFRGLPRVDTSLHKFETSCPVTGSDNLRIKNRYLNLIKSTNINND